MSDEGPHTRDATPEEMTDMNIALMQAMAGLPVDLSGFKGLTMPGAGQHAKPPLGTRPAWLDEPTSDEDGAR